MKKLNDLLARIPEKALAKQRAELPKNVVQLPLWPDPVKFFVVAYLHAVVAYISVLYFLNFCATSTLRLGSVSAVAHAGWAVFTLEEVT